MCRRLCTRARVSRERRENTTTTSCTNDAPALTLHALHDSSGGLDVCTTMYILRIACNSGQGKGGGRPTRIALSPMAQSSRAKRIFNSSACLSTRACALLQHDSCGLPISAWPHFVRWLRASRPGSSIRRGSSRWVYPVVPRCPRCHFCGPFAEVPRRRFERLITSCQLAYTSRTVITAPPRVPRVPLRLGSTEYMAPWRLVHTALAASGVASLPLASLYLSISLVGYIM